MFCQTIRWDCANHTDSILQDYPYGSSALSDRLGADGATGTKDGGQRTEARAAHLACRRLPAPQVIRQSEGG